MSVIHLFKIDNETNKPTDFQHQCRLSVGLFVPKLRPTNHFGNIR